MDITPFQLEWDNLRLYGFTTFFVVAGIAHLIRPKAFTAIIPFLPYKLFIVYVTGIIEIGLGLALLVKDYRIYTIWLIIIYLLAIYPGNIYMALHPERYDFSRIALYLRLPFQFLFIWWVYSLRSVS